MYLVLVPFLDLFGYFDLKYTERLDMIKKSLSFKSCRWNTKLSYLLLLVEIVASLAFINSKYKLSTKEYTYHNICQMFLINFVLFCFIYTPFSLCCYEYFDKEDYRNRRRAAEVLSEERIERLESFEINEEVENTHEISVPTTDLTVTNTVATDN